eukprot:1860452-Amphidinium_carterae.1
MGACDVFVFACCGAITTHLTPRVRVGDDVFYSGKGDHVQSHDSDRGYARADRRKNATISKKGRSKDSGRDLQDRF